LRRATGKTVTQYVQDEICKPLGITNLHIGLPAERTIDTARLTFDGVHGSLNLDHCGTPEMVDNPALFANHPMVQQACMPSINMMTSARALATVYASLVGHGVNGVRLLTDRSVDHARSVQRYAIDATSQGVMVMGLGFQLPAYDTVSAMAQRRGVFGHGGWGGSISFADPEHDFAFALTKTRMVNSEDTLPVSLAVAQALRAELGIPEA
jgi:CubicO group peptidase (beta-lactamase class C family)